VPLELFGPQSCPNGFLQIFGWLRAVGFNQQVIAITGNTIDNNKTKSSYYAVVTCGLIHAEIFNEFHIFTAYWISK